MSRTLFLDIDGVLMAHTKNPPGKTSGFTDWRKVPKPRPFGWGGWISDQQRALILDVFGNPDDHIVWLTTWEISEYAPGGANRAFSDHLGWAHHETFDDEWLQSAFNFSVGWWKRDIVHRAHTGRHPFAMADHIVWVDDELAGRQQDAYCRAMLDRHNRLTSDYTLVGPYPAWSRESIESFRLT